MKCMAYKPILKYFIKFRINSYSVMRVLVTYTFFPLCLAYALKRFQPNGNALYVVFVIVH